MNLVSVRCLLIFLELCLVVPYTEPVRVGPCPTNKVGRHRQRQAHQGRTFGHFVQLFDDNQGGSSLQDRPEDDECDDIEDYDDTDFSSLTNNQQRPGDNRLFFNLLWKPPQGQTPTTPVPQRPDIPAIPQRPQVPNRPNTPPNRPNTPTRPPKRPPSGGYLSGNQYSPPLDESPSDQVKPVYESNFEIPAPYRPSIIGGPMTQVIGVGQTPLRPPRPTASTSRPPCYYYTPRPTSRPQRTGRFSNSVIGSFIDLFLD